MGALRTPPVSSGHHSVARRSVAPIDSKPALRAIPGSRLLRCDTRCSVQLFEHMRWCPSGRWIRVLQCTLAFALQLPEQKSFEDHLCQCHVRHDATTRIRVFPTHKMKTKPIKRNISFTSS